MEINLVAEGLKFMVLGMGVVFVFLALLVLMMKGQARIVAYLTSRPKPAPEPVYEPADDERARVAAIIAAVSAYRKERKG
jgi:oxaloacetate decarboxylase gamma subunit